MTAITAIIAECHCGNARSEADAAAHAADEEIVGNNRTGDDHKSRRFYLSNYLSFGPFRTAKIPYALL